MVTDLVSLQTNFPLVPFLRPLPRLALHCHRDSYLECRTPSHWPSAARPRTTLAQVAHRGTAAMGTGIWAMHCRDTGVSTPSSCWVSAFLPCTTWRCSRRLSCGTISCGFSMASGIDISLLYSSAYVDRQHHALQDSENRLSNPLGFE